MAALNTLLAALQSAIGSVPIGFGKKGRPVHSAPPNYTIFPLRETFVGVQGAGGAGNPRLIHQRIVEIDIHSWGDDFGPTEDMNETMITAIRTVLSGANYVLGSADWVDPLNMDLGVVLVQHVQLTLGLPLANLPLVYTGGTAVNVDALYQKVTVTATGADTAGTVFGDGKLDINEG